MTQGEKEIIAWVSGVTGKTGLAELADPVSGLKDGTALCVLVAKILGKRVPHNVNPRNIKMMEIENISTFLRVVDQVPGFREALSQANSGSLFTAEELHQAASGSVDPDINASEARSKIFTVLSTLKQVSGLPPPPPPPETTTMTTTATSTSTPSTPKVEMSPAKQQQKEQQPRPTSSSTSTTKVVTVTERKHGNSVSSTTTITTTEYYSIPQKISTSNGAPAADNSGEWRRISQNDATPKQQQVAALLSAITDRQPKGVSFTPISTFIAQQQQQQQQQGLDASSSRISPRKEIEEERRRFEEERAAKEEELRVKELTLEADRRRKQKQLQREEEQRKRELEEQLAQKQLEMEREYQERMRQIEQRLREEQRQREAELKEKLAKAALDQSSAAAAQLEAEMRRKEEELRKKEEEIRQKSLALQQWEAEQARLKQQREQEEAVQLRQKEEELKRKEDAIRQKEKELALHLQQQQHRELSRQRQLEQQLAQLQLEQKQMQQQLQEKVLEQQRQQKQYEEELQRQKEAKLQEILQLPPVEALPPPPLAGPTRVQQQHQEQHIISPRQPPPVPEFAPIARTASGFRKPPPAPEELLSKPQPQFENVPIAVTALANDGSNSSRNSGSRGSSDDDDDAGATSSLAQPQPRHRKMSSASTPFRPKITDSTPRAIESEETKLQPLRLDLIGTDQALKRGSLMLLTSSLLSKKLVPKYFVLYKDEFEFHKTEPQGAKRVKSEGFIPIMSDTVVKREENLKMAKDKEHPGEEYFFFSVSRMGKILVIGTTSRKEMEEWVYRINECIEFWKNSPD